MLSAKEMTAISISSTANPKLNELENIIKERASQNKFYALIYKGASESKETSIIFIRKFGIDAYRTIKNLGYIVTSFSNKDEVELYIGWGTNSDSLRADIKLDGGGF